jgi:hypothetical protein
MIGASVSISRAEGQDAESKRVRTAMALAERGARIGAA